MTPNKALLALLLICTSCTSIKPLTILHATHIATDAPVSAWGVITLTIGLIVVSLVKFRSE